MAENLGHALGDAWWEARVHKPIGWESQFMALYQRL